MRGRRPSPVEFWEELLAWASSAGVVSAFARLSLFEDQLVEFPRGQVTVDRPNVAIDLRGDEQSLWRSYDHKVRKNVNRARREGLEFSIDEAGSSLWEFVRVYRATLDRRDAKSRYRFRDSVFCKMRRDLAGQFVIANALDDGRVVSSEIVLLSARAVYPSSAEP